MDKLIKLTRKAIEENMYNSDLVLELELMYEEMILSNENTKEIEYLIKAIKKGA